MTVIANEFTSPRQKDLENTQLTNNLAGTTERNNQTYDASETKQVNESYKGVRN